MPQGKLAMTLSLNVKRRCYLPLLTAAITCATSHAATFTVTTTNDTGLGSLRQALDQANANSDLDTIAFNIPGAGVQTITPASALPNITTPVVIDGYTQPGASSNTLASGENAVLLIELNGNNAGFTGLNFIGGGSNSTVRGLVLNRFGGFGAIFLQTSSNVVEGCFIGTDPLGTIARQNSGGVRTGNANGNRIGGITPAARNVISGNNGHGLQLDFTSVGIIVQGNFIGTDASGTNVLVNNGDGIFINFANNCVIGGTNIGARNIIAGNGNSFGIQANNSGGHVIQGNFIGTDVTGTRLMSFGTALSMGNSSSSLVGGLTPTPGSPPGNVIAGGVNGGVLLANGGHIIQGNLIGTDASGTLDFGSGNEGITLNGANNCTIGGASAGAGNVISGHLLNGIFISSGSGNVIQGNRIGTDITGANPIGNSANGIRIGDRDNFLLGNIVAFNSGDGVNIEGMRATNNLISANSIFSNGALGIDLEGLNGRDSNDAGDADVGPNHLQNFPFISNVVVSLAGVTFQGFLASAPNAPYIVEFFINPLCDSSASCEAQTFIGSTNLTTDATGTNFFSVTMSANVTCRFQASATATDTNNNTSELSVCRLSTGIDTDGDRACDAEEVLAGTDVNDSASVFRMTGIRRDGNNIHVTWQAGGGRTNMLQTIIDLAECGDFSDLPPHIALPDSGNVFTNRLHIGGATNRSGFYRARLVR